MNLLIMDLPGTGEGTQTVRTVEKFGVAHIFTGDMFRAAVADKTKMGILAKSFIDKSGLAPDEVTNGIAKERLVQDDITEKGPLLDGYPRTIEQVHALDETLSSLGLELDDVIDIEVNPESLIECLSGRTTNRRTGETSHKVLNPLIGDYNEDDFHQREDGKPETVKRCLDVSIAQDVPIIEYYRKTGIIFDVQGNQDIDGVLADTAKTISSLK